tara:strand:+ start:139 stop:402 length:264 start_codon:yes stop_codon:yes gene_type:complete
VSSLLVLSPIFPPSFAEGSNDFYLKTGGGISNPAMLNGMKLSLEQFITEHPIQRILVFYLLEFVKNLITLVYILNIQKHIVKVLKFK